MRTVRQMSKLGVTCHDVNDVNDVHSETLCKELENSGWSSANADALEV